MKRSLPAPMEARAVVKAERGAVIIRRTIIPVRRGRPVWISIGRRARRWIWHRLVHVEEDAIGNVIFRSEHVAGAKDASLWVLIGDERQGAHDVVFRAEVVEGAVGVAPDF